MFENLSQTGADGQIEATEIVQSEDPAIVHLKEEIEIPWATDKWGGAGGINRQGLGAQSAH
ncbi:hypothetical protein GCM10023333_34800 [Ferrimonas pelagia]|uniref:Uncharacterized protein n=1 Tax=Ferrimonas pelagia TaxID=1177826 RepID=A0ABP9FDD4_9GAMM